jgi:hypothetical protein
VLDPDDTLQLEDPQGLTDGQPAHPEVPGEIGLVRQAVAGRDPTAEHVGPDVVDDPLERTLPPAWRAGLRCSRDTPARRGHIASGPLVPAGRVVDPN